MSDPDERRWDRWAWLTLGLGLILLFLPLVTNLITFRYPSDGWESTSASGFGLTGPYRMLENVGGDPSSLQPEDRVLAIDGVPLDDDSLPPIPLPLAVGQTLHYRIERGGEELDMDVPVVTLATRAMWETRLRDLRGNPGNTLFGLSLLVIGSVVFLLRPGNPAARYLFLFVMFNQGTGLSLSAGLYLQTYPRWLAFLRQIHSWGWVYVFMPAITMIVLTFPVRAWPVRRFPRLTPFLLIGLPLAIAIAANAAVWFAGIVRAAELLLPLTIYSVGLLLLLVPATLVYNLFKIRDPLPRMQMRWIALGFGLGFVLPLSILILNFTVVGFGGNDMVTRYGNLALILMPVCLAIGILRYRLFDIDVIIRRTTSYAIITALLALIYFGSVVVFQNLFSRVTGQDSTVAVVLSTLLIAALFNPIRRRVQDLIDRRFNRTRYDAEKTLARFATSVRDEPDLEKLTAELLNVIQDTMQPASLSIWLRDPAAERPLVQGGADHSEPVSGRA